MAKWTFTTLDNSNKRQTFTVTAPSKADAIKRGIDRAKRTAAGDITRLTCSIKTA